MDNFCNEFTISFPKGEDMKIYVDKNQSNKEIFENIKKQIANKFKMEEGNIILKFNNNVVEYNTFDLLESEENKSLCVEINDKSTKVNNFVIINLYLI